VATTGTDIALWVRLKPGVDGVDIAIIEWSETPRVPDLVDTVALDAQAALMRPGWTWRVDGRLQFESMASDSGDLGHDLPHVGEPLSAYFRLIEGDGDDPLPLLAAVSARRPFSGQGANLRTDEGFGYVLAGLPLFDARGRLIGYRGHASPVTGSTQVGTAREAVSVQDAAAGYSPAFARKLDSALRQPLGRIIANANTISDQREGPVRADYASYAADIAATGRHLVELVDDLADLQAIERPDFVVAREAVDIADLGRRAAGLLRMRASERRVTIDPPDMDEQVLVTAEYRRVLQILVNLVGNAVRYAPDDSHVWIRVDQGADSACITVGDQGMGIDPADHERIFHRFERLTPEDGAGSGLGLYISRRLARAMGGDISVASAPGQGARFMLRLPIWRVNA
jgi:signal transduction histidine kinase